MTSGDFSRFRERLMVKIREQLVVISVEVYEPPKPVGTVICLHDFGGEARDFERLAGFLIASRYRVVCPDLPGHGDSAFLAGAHAYGNRSFLLTLAAIMRRFARGDLTLLGRGWGGLHLLLLLQRAKVTLNALILTDLKLPWHPETDPAIKDAMVTAGRHFATAEVATAALLATGEFAGLDAGDAAALAARRIRLRAAGYATHFDPQLLAIRERFAGKQFDFRPMLPKLPHRLLYLAGPALDAATRASLAPHPEDRATRTVIDGLQPAGRLSLTTARELLLILGFIEARGALP